MIQSVVVTGFKAINPTERMAVLSLMHEDIVVSFVCFFKD